MDDYGVSSRIPHVLKRQSEWILFQDSHTHTHTSAIGQPTEFGHQMGVFFCRRDTNIRNPMRERVKNMFVISSLDGSNFFR